MNIDIESSNYRYTICIISLKHNLGSLLSLPLKIPACDKYQNLLQIYVKSYSVVNKERIHKPHAHPETWINEKKSYRI
jgi:hypothetical protein